MCSRIIGHINLVRWSRKGFTSFGAYGACYIQQCFCTGLIPSGKRMHCTRVVSRRCNTVLRSSYSWHRCSLPFDCSILCCAPIRTRHLMCTCRLGLQRLHFYSTVEIKWRKINVTVRSKFMFLLIVKNTTNTKLVFPWRWTYNIEKESENMSNYKIIS